MYMYVSYMYMYMHAGHLQLVSRAIPSYAERKRGLANETSACPEVQYANCQ